MKFGEDLATFKQIEYIKGLCEASGTDPDEYNFAKMTKAEASKAIERLKPMAEEIAGYENG